MFKNFPLDCVRLTGGDFALRRELVKQYVRSFDLDRLLHTFRLNAGLPSAAQPLGGWEEEKCELRGHFVGHFLSACSKFAFADHDPELAQKAARIVEVLSACAREDGYLSAFPEEALDTLEREENRNVWAPYYTLHKILQGLVDCHVFTGNAQALSLANGLADYIGARFEKLSFWKIDGILRCTKVNPVNEFGGLGDALYSLYEITGRQEVLKLAQLFDREYWIGNLEQEHDVLTDLHANTHLPMVIAAMHRYRLTGEPRYRRAAENFVRYLRGRSFANGNSSSKAVHFLPGGTSERAEHWGAYGDLYDALTGGESESCCAHNAEKVLEALLGWELSAETAAQLECLKFNAVLNCASAETGLSQYHQPMGRNVHKTFSTPYETFWCCTASGVEAMSEAQKNIWFYSGNAILLNAPVASEVEWREQGVRLRLETRYPDALDAVLTVSAAEPRKLKILLKSDSVESAYVDGERVGAPTPEGFFAIERTFCDGERLEIRLRADLHLEPLPGAPEEAALRYGSILLAQVGGEESYAGLKKEGLGDQFVLNEQGPLRLRRKGGNPTVSYIPLFRVEKERYTVYGRLGEPKEEQAFVEAKDGRQAYQK